MMSAYERQRQRNHRAYLLLRQIMVDSGVTYEELGKRIGEKPANLQNRIPRGAFTAAFFLKCSEACGCRSIKIAR